MRHSDELTTDDFRQHPIWQFIRSDNPADEKRELAVKPVIDLPVETMEGRFIGIEGRMACGRGIWVELLGLKLKNPRLTKLTMSIIVHNDGRKFLMRRAAPAVSGPSCVADFLGLKIEQVFPIHYDISAFAIGEPGVLKGDIQIELDEQVSRSELLRLIQEDRRNKLGDAEESHPCP